MESVALPLEGKPALDAEEGPRSRRAAHRQARPDDSALAAIRAVSSRLDSAEDLPAFFGHLSSTVAEQFGASRAAFWRLGSRGSLALQPAPFGFADDSPIYQARLQVGAGGAAAIEQLVFGDQLDVVRGTAPDLDAIWRSAGLNDVTTSLAAAWQVGERRIGMVAVYDAPRGFSGQDLRVLRLVGSVAGLLWQYRESEDQLGHTAVRLEEAMVARRHLLNNIAAGGDEARRRFATALHDDSLQLLTAAELQLERIRTDAKGSRHAVNLDHLRVTLRKVEDSLRRLLTNVSPEPVPLPSDLNDAISERLESMRIGAGIEPHIESRLPSDMPPAIQGIVLKNISEALTNVEKHARATRVTVVTEGVNRGLRVEVRDNGKGFIVAESVRVLGHIGLVALKERAQLAGGWCRIESEPGAGTRIEFWVPLTL